MMMMMMMMMMMIIIIIIIINVKVKFHPIAGHEGPEGSKGTTILFLQPRR
jgi:hypothetical protein